MASFDLSPDGRILAFVANEDGASVLHLMEVQSAKGTPGTTSSGRGDLRTLLAREQPRSGVPLSYAQSRRMRIRWTWETGNSRAGPSSETGGLDATQFRSPEWIRVKSFDGLPVSGFAYRPDPMKFPGDVLC